MLHKNSIKFVCVFLNFSEIFFSSDNAIGSTLMKYVVVVVVAQEKCYTYHFDGKDTQIMDKESIRKSYTLAPMGHRQAKNQLRRRYRNS